MPNPSRSFPVLGLAAAALLAALTPTACGGQTTSAVGPEGASGGDASATSSDGGVVDEDVPLVPATKVDVLLVVDDSASMADKAN